PPRSLRGTLELRGGRPVAAHRQPYGRTRRDEGATTPVAQSCGTGLALNVVGRSHRVRAWSLSGILRRPNVTSRMHGVSFEEASTECSRVFARGTHAEMESTKGKQQ